MGMIGKQAEGLRDLAGDGSMEWVPGPIRASILRDAADTIDELRDQLQYERQTARARLEAIDRIKAENAKLRKLVADMWRELAAACAEQVTSYDTLREFSDRIRELEVNQ